MKTEIETLITKINQEQKFIKSIVLSEDGFKRLLLEQGYCMQALMPDATRIDGVVISTEEE
jgi:hypothetical protein